MSLNGSRNHQNGRVLQSCATSSVRADTCNVKGTSTPRTQHQKRKRDEQDDTCSQFSARHIAHSSSSSNIVPAISQFKPPTPPVSGKYTIQCRSVSAKFGEEYPNLLIIKAPDRDVFWGCFRWGPFKGMMRIIPGDQFDDDHALSWRATNLDDDTLHFRKHCRGWIYFAKNRVTDEVRLTGELWNLPGITRAQFNGGKTDQKVLVRALDNEWDSLIQHY